MCMQVLVDFVCHKFFFWYQYVRHQYVCLMNAVAED